MSTKVTQRKMKQKIVEGHITQCNICFEMERRGYRSEEKYWSDYFQNKERPVKYELVYKGKVVTESKTMGVFLDESK